MAHRPGPWLWAAAVLVAVASSLDALPGLPLLWWLGLYGVWRGLHVAWVLVCSCATFVALLGTVGLLTPSPEDGNLPASLLYAAVVALLLGRPVRRLVGRAPALPAPA